MIDPSRTVALVGRPNVGKSRLFNRLCGKRMSIVHDMPGVTRDLISTEVNDDYVLLDTGGIGMEIEMTSKKISVAAEEQVEFAIQAASVILFVVDAREGITVLDEIVGQKLRRYGKKVLLVANKVDFEEHDATADEFVRLGLGDPYRTSAEHGRGFDDLNEAIEQALGPKPETSESEKTKRINISLVGRPNVGKSSIGNKLLNSKRLIVSDVAGTTRDSVELDLDYTHKDGEVLKFRMADTAGLRGKSKVDSPVEYFSSVRTQAALERSDVVFLIIDAVEGVTKQDQALAGAILDAGRALVIVVNKWDLIIDRWERDPIEGFKNIKHFLTSYEKSLRKEMFFLPDPPVLFVSAKSGFRIESMLETAAGIEATLDMKLPTGKLNSVIEDLFEARSPKVVGTKRFKVFYAVQTGSRPMRIRFFCNRIERLDPSYRRYLEKAIIHEFRLSGCPVRFDLVGKEKRYEEGGENPAPRHNDTIQNKARLRKMGENAAKIDTKHPERRAKIVQKKAAHNKGGRKR
ncbi:MAG: ribosome biogenesis GTPase Der [Opitutales bacterium]|jgi:GTPase|nr:ribosome biogenesis GTPase Der [Opitutales bacterium]MDP4643783.1 ribosome biogenesis GTPase Der [Opitutales bacterium]MDP4777185.1 ribosome biogenesis GTPase Der [Opitutales bacterium]MDP4879670.1 ribosome biogenesis GTPase Der [Opitutales bacterium]MDP4884745.1 ribosome biogenesis GTPase Der [Opitutales bacterium]